MIVATLLFGGATLAFALLAVGARSASQSRLALGALGLLTGVGIIMLSGRVVGLVWLLSGGMVVVSALSEDTPGHIALRTRWLSRLIPALFLSVMLAIVLLWEPPALGLPLEIVPLDIAATVAIAFGHHTWAVVGLALLALVAAARPTRDGEA